MTTTNKHRTATKLANKYRNTLPLNPDISGTYKYIKKGQKYISCNKSKHRGVKQVHSIVIGMFKPVVFINHKDYSKEMVDYIEFGNDSILFTYNGDNYLLPIFEQNTDYVIVKKQD